MAKYNPSTRERIADLVQGLRVERVAEAIPVTSDTLFNIVGGSIALLSLVGEVTDTFDGTATTLLVVANPTAAGDNTPLCTATGVMNGVARGIRVTLPAAAGSGMILSTTDGAEFMASHPPWLVEAGTLDLTVGTGGNAGLMKWILHYVPVDVGAYVEVAA